jgi:hypothetical protein
MKVRLDPSRATCRKFHATLFEGCVRLDAAPTMSIRRQLFELCASSAGIRLKCD